MWIKFNPNPAGRAVGDCAVRAVSKALDVTWDEAYTMLVAAGYAMKDMPSSNSVWGALLLQHGFQRSAIPDSCPDCYTAQDFCVDHPKGVFVLGFGNHTCCIKNGDVFDSWDSTAEIPQYYWYKQEED